MARVREENRETHPQASPRDLLGQREVGDVIYSDQLPDLKAAKVLKGFDIAEPGDWIQELDRRWRKTFGKKQYWRQVLD